MSKTKNKKKKNSYIQAVKEKAIKIAKKTKDAKKLRKLVITHRSGDKTKYLVKQMTVETAPENHKTEVRFNTYVAKKGEVKEGKYVKRKISHISNLKLKNVKK